MKTTTQKKPFFSKTLRRFLGIGLLCLMIPFFAFSIWLMLLYRETEKDFPTLIVEYDLSLSQTKTAFSAQNIPYEDLPPALIKTLVAIDDPHFFEHNGIDFPQFFRGLGSMVLHRIGRYSTLDSQLARNLLIHSGKNTNNQRYMKSLFLLPILLEKHYTKAQLLTLYVNSLNFYGNKYGIEATSQELFQCKAKDLSLQQIALIVGLLKRQGYYNPYKYPDRAFDRRNTILNLMAKENIYPTTWKDSLMELPLALTPANVKE